MSFKFAEEVCALLDEPPASAFQVFPPHYLSFLYLICSSLLPLLHTHSLLDKIQGIQRRCGKVARRE